MAVADANGDRKETTDKAASYTSTLEQGIYMPAHVCCLLSVFLEQFVVRPLSVEIKQGGSLPFFSLACFRPLVFLRGPLLCDVVACVPCNTLLPVS